MRYALLAMGLLSFAGSLNAREIVLRVVDRQRRPVPKATVWIVPCDAYDAFLAPPRVLPTDATGSLRLAPEAWMGGGWRATHLRFWAVKGHQKSIQRTWAPTHPFTFVRLTLRDARPLLLTAQITDAQGQPASRSWVIVYRLTIARTWQMIGIWQANAFGIADLHLLSLPSEEQECLLLAFHPDAGWAWKMVDIGKARQIPLTLAPPRPTLLSVRDCFGEAVAGLVGRIALLQNSDFPMPLPLPAFVFAFRSDERGQFILPLPPKSQARWEWNPQAPWGLRAFKPFLWVATDASQTVRFHWRTVKVIGRLLNAQTKKPLRGETVCLSVHDPMATAAALTYCSHSDSEGRFFVQTKPSYHAFSKGDLLLPDGSLLPLWQEPAPSVVPPLPPLRCQQWDIGDLALSPPVGTVSGKVVDPKGQPLPFACVEARGEKSSGGNGWFGVKVRECDDPLWRTKATRAQPSFPFALTFADHQGNFALALRANSWRLIALRSGPPHRSPSPPPKGSFLLPLGFGSLVRVTPSIAPPRLTVVPKANLKIVLTTTAWSYIGAGD